MKIPFNKQWIVLEREDYANYVFVVSTWEQFTVFPKKIGFENSHFLSAEYMDGACNLFITLDSYKKISQSYFQTLFTKHKLWDRVHKDTRKYAKLLFKISAKIKRLPVSKLTDRELIKWRKEVDVLNVEVHDRRGFMFFIETVDNILTNYLYGYLGERAEDLKIKSISSTYAFQILTTPTDKSIINQEKESLLKIALIKDKDKQQRALVRHSKKYEWLEYGLQGRMLDYNHFLNELADIKRRNPAKLLKELRNGFNELSKKQKEIIRLFNINPQHVKIFDIAREAIYCKGLGKDAQFYEFYCLEELLKEMGRRTGLTLEQTKFLTITDLETALLKKKDLSDKANQNRKYSIHFAEAGKTLFYNGNQGVKIRSKLKFVDPTTLAHSEEKIKGQPAFAGYAKGKVKIVNTPQEMIKMHQGDVLVSHMTNPDIVPAMKKASAIVTDLGGITCHAAIVSRELKVPCVIGTKIATQVFKDGDIVEVDAAKGIVKLVK